MRHRNGNRLPTSNIVGVWLPEIIGRGFVRRLRAKSASVALRSGGISIR